MACYPFATHCWSLWFSCHCIICWDAIANHCVAKCSCREQIVREAGGPEAYILCWELGRKNPIFSDNAFTLSQEFHPEHRKGPATRKPACKQYVHKITNTRPHSCWLWLSLTPHTDVIIPVSTSLQLPSLRLWSLLPVGLGVWLDLILTCPTVWP